MKQITFIIPYPLNTAPSQRFRFEFFLLQIKKSYHLDICSFYSAKDYFQIREGNSTLKTLWIATKGIFRRFAHIIKASRADLIFIHREAAPAGPPWIEFILCRLLKKKIIYDFDDAIWLSDPHESGFRTLIKWKRKVRMICRWSYRVSCGNAFLANFAADYCDDVRIIPTVVDTGIHKPLSENKKEHDAPVIGWTGSATTLVYLNEIMPTLVKIHQQIPFTLSVIADKSPDIESPFIRFIPWSSQTEVSELASCDIGIMPLPDDMWAKGKCGFKLIQYGAVGLPSVASDVGVNKKIVENNITGFLCTNEEEWISYLSRLLTDNSLRKQMGTEARKKILEEYSVNSIRQEFLDLFKD